MSRTPPPEWTPPDAGIAGGSDEDVSRYRSAFVDMVRSFTRDVLRSSEYEEDAHTDEIARDSLAHEMTRSVLLAAGVTTAEASLAATPSGGASAATTPRRWEVARQIARSVVLDAAGVLQTPPPEVPSQGDDDEDAAKTPVAEAQDPQEVSSPIVAREVAESLMMSLNTVLVESANATAIQSCVRGYAARHEVAVASQSALALLAIVRSELLEPAIDSAITRRAFASDLLDRELHAHRSRLVRSHRAAMVLSATARFAASAAHVATRWEATMIAAIVPVQAFCRAVNSHTFKEVLRTNCYQVLQRISRGLQARRRVCRLRDAIPQVQAAARAFASLELRNAKHAAVVAKNAGVVEACWLAHAHAQHVRQRCTEAANAGMCVIQAAARSALLQLLSQRLKLVRATQAPPVGVNRVLHRLLLFLPDEEETYRRQELLAANARRHEAAIGVRRAATPGVAPPGRRGSQQRRSVREADPRKNEIGSPTRRRRDRSKSVSVQRTRRRAANRSPPPPPAPQHQCSLPPAVASAALVSGQQDFTATISAMSKLVSLSKVASTSVARRELSVSRKRAELTSHRSNVTSSDTTSKHYPLNLSAGALPAGLGRSSVSAVELVRLAKRTAAASGAMQKKPDWH